MMFLEESGGAETLQLWFLALAACGRALMHPRIGPFELQHTTTGTVKLMHYA